MQPNGLRTHLLKIYFHLFLFFILYSCSSSENPTEIIKPIQEIDIPLIEKVKIDSVDLFQLPKDTGGLHLSFPLGTTDAKLGYCMYQPSAYDSTNLEYPLLIFLHGLGEVGNSKTNANDLEKVKIHGPPKLIEAGEWNPKYPMLVASPQLTSSASLWSIGQVHSFIEYVSNEYRVNKSRIYLSGLSIGGQAIFEYGGIYGDNGYAAVLVPVCGKGQSTYVEKLSTLPIWAFHGADDNLIKPFSNYGSVVMVEAINNSSPKYKAKVTIYPNVGHDSWTITYNGKGNGKEDSRYDKYDVNLYDWMLQFKKE